jgi:hypothetical protein
MAQSMVRTVPKYILVVAVAVAIVSGVALHFGRFFPVALAMVPPLFLVGIAMRIFPGAEPPENVPDNVRAKLYFDRTPGKHKLMWVLAGVLGIPPGIYLIYRLGAFAT